MARGIIPAGLKASSMRARMEDKATITQIGGLYIGGTTPITFIDEGGGTLSSYATTELGPGSANLPLTSNGVNQIPSYKQVATAAVSDRAITSAKLGTGTVVDKNGHRMILDVKQNALDPNILEIRYYQAN